jgi:acetylornithine deacetylase
LKRAAIELKGDLIVAAVVGELQGGVGTVYLLDHGIKPNMAILPEPFGTYNITTKHGGMCEMAIHTLGRSRHISLMEQGIDAINKMTTVTKALSKMEFTYTCDPELPGLPRMVVGSIIGGRGKEHELRGPSFLSDHCTIFIDIRFVRGMSPESIKKDIERELSRLAMEDPDLKFEIEFPPDPKYRMARIPMYPLDVSREQYIVQTLRGCFLEVTGQEPRQIGLPIPIYKAYTGVDSGHFWQKGIPCCIFGPAGDWENSQYTDVDEMILCSKVMALTALEVCG